MHSAKTIKYFFFCIAISMYLLMACNKNAAAPPINVSGNYIVNAEAKSQFSKDQVKNLYSSYGAGSYLRNGIKTYSITCKTKTYTGADVIASASVVVPDAAGPFPLINYNHGTFFPSDEWRVPSYNNDFNSDINIAYMMASVGYVVVSPDYIG